MTYTVRKQDNKVPSKSFEILWEKCQIVYKGKKYNLATDEFYEYLKAVGLKIKQCTQ